MKNYLKLKQILKIVFLCSLFFTSSFASWIVHNERNFTLRNTNGTTGDNIYGDFNVTGASILCATKSNGQCDWSYSDMLANANTKYLTDIPTSQITLNSSSADLNIPSDATITKAYLYWSGHIHGTTATQTAYNTAIAGYNTVIFRTPDGTNHTITADTNDSTKVNYYAYLNDTTNTKGFRFFYQATVDVTDIVKNGGYASNKKTFTVGNIKTNQGTDDYMYEPEVSGNVRWGNMGGWSLIVEYTRAVSTGQQYKNVSIYDGFKLLLPPTNQTETLDINISGFLTPLSQVPSGSMAFYAMGGEKSLTGEKVKISNKSNTLQDLYNSINPVGNFLNDSISLNGTNLVSTHIYNPGIDLDVFDIKTSCKNSSGATVACIDSNQTQTDIRLSITNNNNTSDQSFVGMIAFSIDIYQPNISSFTKTSNTSSTQVLYPGDSVEYALDFNNSGTEAAENVTIYDTFSSSVGGDMLLDIIDRNATAIKNSIRLKNYNETNYHCAIGSTDTACDTLAKDANCSVDYADNNTSKATRVWCNLSYMAVNERDIMKFSVKIRDDYNQSLPEQNVTNVAYSHYYNAATHEEITVLGQSNINTAGVIGGAVAYNSLLDVVDSYNNTYSYYNPVGLQTKIANKSNYTLEAVYLGDDTSNPHPTIYDGSIYDMLVLFRLSDSTCTEDNNISNATTVTATFTHGTNQYTAVSNAFTIVNNARKVGRIKAHFIDWNKISLNLVGNNCVNNSSIDGNLKGVPQCLNGNENKIPALVTVDVSECVTPYGSYNAPCDSEAYNSSGTKGNIYPPKYNNNYGCLMCLSDKINGTNNCSTDTFAIRPNDFNSTITNHQQFIADKNTSVTFYANQYGGTGTTDYNETMDNSFKVDVNISDNTKTCAAPSIAISPIVVFSNGQITNTYNLPNVGDFNLTIHEIPNSEYAIIDADDTPDSTRYISPYTQQITVVPDHFLVEGNLTNGSNGFTYLSNFETYPNTPDRNISAKLDLNITAKSFLNNTTSNYTNLCYAKDGNITLATNTTGSNLSGLSKLLWYDAKHDLNGSVPLVASSSYVMDLNKTQFDSTTTNGMSESQYLINFNRAINQTVDPFTFLVTTVSTKNEDNRTGTLGLNQNALYYYGRVYSTDYRGKSPIPATIRYEAYCGSNCTTFGLTTQSPLSVTWYQNPLHVTSDGNVTQFSSASIGSKATTISNSTMSTINNGLDTTHSLSNTNAPYTDRIEMTPSAWLIYNAANAGATTNDFNVEFIHDGNWTGQGKLGKTIDVNSSIRTNKRMEW